MGQADRPGELFVVRRQPMGLVGFPVTLPTATLTAPTGMRTGDANGDGIEDLFVATSGGTVLHARTIEVFLGDGHGSFDAGSVVSVDGNSTVGDFVVADVNGDGLDDAVLGAGFGLTAAAQPQRADSRPSSDRGRRLRSRRRRRSARRE